MAHLYIFFIHSFANLVNILAQAACCNGQFSATSDNPRVGRKKFLVRLLEVTSLLSYLLTKLITGTKKCYFSAL